MAVPKFVGQEVIKPRWLSYENFATVSNLARAVISLSKTYLILEPGCMEMILS